MVTQVAHVFSVLFSDGGNKNACTDCLLRFLNVLQYVREHEQNGNSDLRK